ncbi:MAG TPA: HPr family phosphocarrier protein [Candidatus Limnocylindria bacterium]|nr:HPr family phosphocarrier protein [Candidatus Limnocylindria bacterium]
MTSRTITLGGEVPLTALRARSLVHAANAFSSSILLIDGRGTFNGKSLLGLLSLGKMTGRELRLVAQGRDEEEAVEALSALLEEDAVPSP